MSKSPQVCLYSYLALYYHEKGWQKKESKFARSQFILWYRGYSECDCKGDCKFFHSIFSVINNICHNNKLLTLKEKHHRFCQYLRKDSSFCEVCYESSTTISNPLFRCEMCTVILHKGCRQNITTSCFENGCSDVCSPTAVGFTLYYYYYIHKK
jgi:hypothetical protein